MLGRKAALKACGAAAERLGEPMRALDKVGEREGDGPRIYFFFPACIPSKATVTTPMILMMVS